MLHDDVLGYELTSLELLFAIHALPHSSGSHFLNRYIFSLRDMAQNHEFDFFS